MNGELQRIEERRRRLVALAAAQRTVFALQATAWQPRLALADRGLAVLRYVRRYPAILAGAGVVLALVRPKYSGLWLQRGLMMWQIVRRMRSR